MNKQQGAADHPRLRIGWKFLAGFLTFLYVGTMILMFQADLNAVHEPSLLLPILNTIFAGLIPLGVSVIAARAYLSSGLKNLLFMGCGMLAFGCGAMSAGWLIGGQHGPNTNVTIHNIGVLLASLFHAYGALLLLRNKIAEAMPERRKIKLVMAYAGILLAVSVLTLATLSGATPEFFVQGAGPTLFRQFVLGTAIVLFLLSALVAMRVFVQRKNSFHYWYSFSLTMIALGLTAFFLQSAVGSPIGWLGRAGQYIGGVYALIAVMIVFKIAREESVSFENVMAAIFHDAELAYQTLIETAADPIILFEPDGTIVQWNPAAETVFGYRASEALGSPLPDLIVGETFIGIFRKEIDNLKVISDCAKVGRLLEIAGKSKDQGVVPVEVSISAMKTGGRWICIGVFRDISKRKKAQEALKIANRELAQSNAELEQHVVERTAELQQELAERKRAQEALQETQALLTRSEEIGKLGGWEFDIDTRQQTWTKSIYAIHEVDFTGQPTVEQGISFYTSESRPIIERAVQRAIEHGEAFDLELEIITAKGNLRAVHSIGRHDPARGKIVGFFQDISERKQAQAALIESNDRLAAVMENLTEGLIMADHQGLLIYWNPMALAINGFASMDDCLRPLAEFAEGFEVRLLTEDRPLPVEEWPMSLVLRGEILHDWEVKLRRLDQGWEKIVAYSGWLIHSTDGERLAFLSINDITERKQAEAQRLESEKLRVSEQAAALETQHQSALTALSLMEDALAARRQAEALNAKLKEQVDELRRWQQVTLNRESRIVSVKKEINELLAERGQPPRYPSAAAAESET